MMTVRYAFAAAAALLLASHAPAFAQSAGTSPPPACDSSTIAGDYAVHGSGTIGTVPPLSPEVVVATRHFDGSGSFTGHGRQMIEGTPHEFSIIGTYNVASNCTVTLVGTTDPSSGTQIHWFGVITDAGNAIYVMRSSAGATTSTVFNRITPID